MKVVCVGAGYVGSVTAAAFAMIGHSVTIVDIDRQKIDTIRKGESPIYEPGLSALIKHSISRSLFAADVFDSIGDADTVFICVGTPSKADDTADLTYVKEAAIQIGKHLNPERYTVVVNKSTVPVGTAKLVSSLLEESSGLCSGQAFDVVSNPEFLREGFAVTDVFYPEKIVIGTNSAQAEHTMKRLYEPLMTRESYDELKPHLPSVPAARTKPVWLRATPESSEMIKYASNAFLAVKISYINEIARLCDALGANVTEVAAGMGLDSRIGEKFLQVSSGWSGSCFPKDTAELLATSRKYGCEQQVVKAAVEANEQMHRYCIQKLQSKLKSLNGTTIGVLGLTFKPNTDDARMTQAAFIIRELLELGSTVKAHDPQGMEMFRRVNPRLPVHYCDLPEQTARNADALLLLTHWDSYLTMDWQSIKPTMRSPYVLDTRNALSRDQLVKLGYQYEGLGINT